MKSGIKARIRELAGTVSCAKDFACVKSDFEALCKASDIGLERNLACFEGDSYKCLYRLRLGVGQFCQCPVRFQIAKALQK